MIDFAVDLFKMLAIFALSVYSLEAIVVVAAFVWWFLQYRREVRRGP